MDKEKTSLNISLRLSFSSHGNKLGGSTGSYFKSKTAAEINQSFRYGIQLVQGEIHTQYFGVVTPVVVVVLKKKGWNNERNAAVIKISAASANTAIADFLKNEVYLPAPL